MQSGGGPLQPGPPVMRGLSSGTPTASQQQQQQQQVDMQKMQSQQPPLMNQQQYQQQQPNLYRNPGANQSTRPTRPILTSYGHPAAAPFYAPLFQMPYSRIPAAGQWANYGSMPGMASGYPPQYYIQSAPILAQAQHQQTRRNPAGDNSLVNMQQVPLPQPQPPNQQSSPMTVSHDLLVMQQLHPQQQQPPQQTPQQVAGGGQPPMDQHQPNPAQVSVGGPQPPPNALMSQLHLPSHLAAPGGAAPIPAKVNKKKQRGSRAIPIINPDTQEDVLDKIYNDSAPPTSSATVSSSSGSTGGVQQPPPQQQQQQQPPQQQPPQAASAPPPTYNTIPPNVTQVPLNPAVEQPDYDNYTSSHHPHQATPDLTGPPGAGGMGPPPPMHHQPPPHLHHPPPLNHPPPHVAHGHVPHGHPPQMQMQIPHDHRGGPPQQLNTQQQPPPPPHELAYHGTTMKYVTPPPHLPHHPSPAEMTVGGTPVVSAIADGPSVEIKPYQNKKKKPTNDPHPQDPQQQHPQIKSLPTQHQPPPPQHHHHQHHHPPPQQQHPQHHAPQPVMLNEVVAAAAAVPPPSLIYPERYRTISEKSIAESTLSTDAEPFVYTGPSSAAAARIEPEVVAQQAPAEPEPVVVVKPVVEEEPKKQLEQLVSAVEKLSVAPEQQPAAVVEVQAAPAPAPASAAPSGGHKKKQHKKRAEESVTATTTTAAPPAQVVATSETSVSSKAAATAVVVVEQAPQQAAAAVDETDRAAVVAVERQSSASSLISNLVEHNNSKLDNDNIINNNNVDCTSTMITKSTTDNATDNNNAAEKPQVTAPVGGAAAAKPEIAAEQQQQPEFDDNKNVVAPETTATAATPAESAAPSKDSTTAATEQQPAKPAPTTAAAPAPAAATIPAKKSRSITLIEYDPDQWSPDNPSGKRKYSRDQLMQLKNAAPAREKPANLPNSLENVLIRSNHGGGGGGGGGGGHGMGGMQYGKSNFSEMLLPTFIKDRMGGGGGGGGGGGNMGQMRQQYLPKRPSQQGNSGQSGSQSNKQSQQGMSKTGSKIIRLQLDEEVKLNECANAWRPRHLQTSVPEVDPETGVDRVTQELFKKFRSVLNKLTPDNFDKLVQQVKGFVIDTDERLDGCIKLVFEKAISEPNFSEAYAKMCKEIGNIAILVSNEKRTSFKGRLLAQCQCEFERRRNDQTSAIRDNRSKLEASKGMAKEQFEELKAQLEEDELRVRRRAVGTVRFIGELFKHGQLTANIMHSCITLLIEKEVKDYDEETLECLCKLLTTIGSKMEKENNQDLSGYFDKMGDIVKHRDQYKISSRIRFMIQDVIDLRRNGWQPRRQDLNPKTMNQIQKEAETEQIQMNMNYMGGRDRGGGGKDGYGGDMGRGGRGGSMQGNKMSGSMGSGYNQGTLGRGGNQGSMKGGRPQQDDDGFQHVVSNSRNNRSTPIDLKKINIPGSVDTTRLGAASAYQGWKNNSNIFAALNNEENQGGGGGGQGNMMDRDGDRDRDRSGSNRDRDRGGSDRNQRDRDRSGSHNKNSGGKDSYHHHNKGSMERDRYARYGSSSSQNDDRMARSSREPSSGSMRPMSGQHSSNSQMHERDRDRDRKQQQQQPLPGRSSQQRHIPQSSAPSAGPPRGGPSSTGTLSKSGSGQLYQQQQLPQFAIPKDVVRRNFPLPDAATEDKLKKFSKTVHLEMDASDVVESVKMLDEINPDYYHAAINELFMENIERDAKSREAVVKVIAHMFEQNVIGKADYLHALEEVFKLADDLIIDLPQLYKYIATFYVQLLHARHVTLADIHSVAQPILASHGGVMLKEALQQYEAAYGRNATIALCSTLNFADFIQLGSNEKVEQFLRDHKLDYLLDSGSKAALDMQTVGAQIKQFLKSNAKFVEIFAWVAQYVGPERVTSDEFIRTLTKAVIEHCIDNKTKLNVPEITKWHQILQKYIDSKPERELQAMYAIQRLVVELEHPQNLLHTILEQLYDFDVIMEGFSLWKDSTDPLEAAGKGVCLKGITQFMTMYMENSSDEDN